MNALKRQILNNFTQSGEEIFVQSVNNNVIGIRTGLTTMTRSNNKPELATNNTKVKSHINNKQRLGTLKLWQKHIEALSKPSPEPMLKRYDEELDAFLDTQMNI